MAADMINTLQELVISICDKLYAERQLITKAAVKKLVQLHDLWSDDELEIDVQNYINEWRLNNLQGGNEQQQELQACKRELAAAQATIRQLNAELTSLRLTVIQNLRGLLHDKT